MTAWRLVEGAARAVADDAPAPGDRDVAIEVEAAWLPRGVRSTPGVAGSAAVGRVVDAGAQARGLVGRRVLVGPHVACGECEVCRRGGAAVCPRGGVLGVDRRGTLADRITVDVGGVIGLDAGLEVPGPAAAAIAGDVAIAYAMYVRASIGPREPAAVIGDDACARFLVQILAAKGVAPVVVPGGGQGDELDVAAVALAAAGHADKPLRLFAATRGAGRVALALAGAARVAPRATVIARVAPGGEDREPMAIEAALLAREIAVHAVVGAHPDLLVEIVALVVRGEVRLADEVAVVGVDAVGAALADAAGRAVVVELAR